jgi:hypothetical protein
MDKSLTDEEIMNLTDNEIPVMSYSDLVKYGVMNVIRESPSHAVIFLVRQNEKYGHWCLLFLKDSGSEQGLHCYDSYGNVPDSKNWKRGLTKKTLTQLHQENPYLLSELYNSGKAIYFNEFHHQANNPSIATCGRHCCVRACFMDLDTDEYNHMITSKSLTPDELVVKMTKDFLN